LAAFVTFMNGAVGRWLRALLGIALIVYGLLVFGGTAGAVNAAVGLLPIALGLWGHSLLELFVPQTRVTS
jgi:hypothetical protein